MGVLLVDAEVEAVSASFGERRDPNVGVLSADDGAEGEVGDLPIVAEIERTADLTALLATAGGAVNGRKSDGATDEGLIVPPVTRRRW